MSDTFLSWFSDAVSWFTDAGKFGTVMTVTGRYDPDGQREV
ncbi:MAG: hypothetical protein U9P10_14210 [Thermodesulfobacteriota bacterium]|nr:hypothetical protein [Thermodesulfobacteriota bacterium]